jgi:hypothetical protein
MKKQPLAALVLVLLAGCTDNIDQLMRDERNLGNEIVDALAVAINEDQAKRVCTFVFERIPARLEKFTDRMRYLKLNTDEKEFGNGLFGSTATALFLAECKINLQRYDMEQLRLKNLIQQIGGDPKTSCPSLLDLTTKYNIHRKYFEKGGDALDMMKNITNDAKKAAQFGDSRKTFDANLSRFEAKNLNLVR